MKAFVPTENAKKYMTQLLKHWGHKFETELDDNTGQVALPSALVKFDARDEGLNITCDLKDGADTDKLKDVIVRHLDRFAFREAPLEYRWD